MRHQERDPGRQARAMQQENPVSSRVEFERSGFARPECVPRSRHLPIHGAQ